MTQCRRGARLTSADRYGRFLINLLLNEAAAPITLLQDWNPEAKK